MFLVDTHAHLDDQKFQSDLDQVLARAKKVNIQKIITVGYNLKSSRNSIELANKYDFIWAATGVHPCDVKELADDQYLKELYALAQQNEKVVAMGEIGLDYHYPNIDQKKQQKAFLNQIKIAQELRLPVIIHSRNAEQDTLDILRQEKVEKGVWHCFSGGISDAEACLELGLNVSFTGTITFPKADNIRAAARLYPLEKIMIESDCPYLAPQKYRGQRNEPAYVIEIAQILAEIKDKSLETIMDITTKNAEMFFQI
jgi:TatD DNase family protein